MDSAVATRIETIVEQAAAASLGLACAYAGSVLLAAFPAHPLRFAEAVGIGAAVYLGAGRLLSGVTQSPALLVRVFDVRTIEPEQERPQLLLTHIPAPSIDARQEPLLLTEVHAPAKEPEQEPLLLTEVHAPAKEPEQEPLLLTEVHATAADRQQEPLVLDDVLAELGPDSRVVRLFDPDAMPTPAQLRSRIDAHLGRGGVDAPAPDASHALHEALAELRRSIG